MNKGVILRTSAEDPPADHLHWGEVGLEVGDAWKDQLVEFVAGAVVRLLAAWTKSGTGPKSKVLGV